MTGSRFFTRGRRVAALVAATVLLASPALAEDGRSRAARVGDATFDLLILRPAGLARMGLGCTTLLIAWPLTAPGGNGEEAVDRLCTSAGRSTFTRELGDLEAFE